MSIALSDLISELQGYVTAVDSIPSSSNPNHYELAVKDAVSAFNRVKGRRALHQFATVANTATYTLPNDFSRIIKLENPFESAKWGVIVGGESRGIIPMNTAVLKEEALVAGLTLTLFPAPSAPVNRHLWYRAVHVLDSGSYPAMTEEEARLIMIKARANAWRVVADKVVRGGGWKYKDGDIEIDKSNVQKASMGWIADMDKNFDAAVKQYRGSAGMVG